MSIYLKILALLAVYGPKIPQAIELITALVALFAPPDNGGLQVVQVTVEESAAEAALSEAYTAATGTAAAFDFSRLRRLIALAESFGFSDLLIAILTRGAGQ